MRVLHLSDLHWPASPTRDHQLIVEKLLDDVVNVAAGGFDLMVFSGDLADRGTYDEMKAAAAAVLIPVQEALRLSREQVILIPGNHDVHRKSADKYSDEGLRRQLVGQHEVNALMADPDDRAMALRRMQEWGRFANEFYGGVGPFATDALAAHKTGVAADGQKYGVVTLNSAWRCFSDEDEGSLLIDLENARAELDAVEDCDVRLVVTHHPRNWLAVWNRDAVRRELASRGTVVLTGHEHESDPTSEESRYGSVVHSRAGALYAGGDYSNHYCALDIDSQARTVTVATRTWFPDRPAFDAAVDLDPGGIVKYTWPPESALAVLPATTETQKVLAEEVQAFTAIANHLRDVEAVNVDDFLVAPRLLGLPFRDAVAARQLNSDRDVPKVDSAALAQSGRVIVVSGDSDSGVTSTLYWLLNRHVEQCGTHRPAHVRVPRGFFRAERFHRDLIKTSRKFVTNPQAGESPSLIAALDDIGFESDAAYAAFAKYVRDNPDVIFVLGCHTAEHDRLITHLNELGVEYSPAYLAPFGREQVRVIIEKITGSFSQELLDKMYAVLAAASLPRDPFLMVALTAVLYSSGDPSSLNESSILDNYVALLLGGAEIVDDEGLQMDRRRREYLLQELAGTLSTLPLQRMLRADAEVFVNEQYGRMEWGNRPQGSRVIESLVKRRALIEIDGYIQFRYSGYFDLFLGKLVLDDESFRARVKEDPLLFGPAIRHASGISRRDRDLLEHVRNVSDDALEKVRGIIDLGDLAKVGAQSHWQNENVGPRILEAMIASDDPVEALSEEEADARRDEMYDDLHVKKEDSVVSLTPAQLDEFERLEQASMLLGQVLKSSEFIQDIEEKTEALASSLDAWGHVMVASVADSTSSSRYDQLREFIRADLELDDAEGRDPQASKEVDFFLDVTILALHAAVAHASMGHSHLEGAFKRVFAQDDYFDRGAEAFIATLVYFFLDLEGWPEYLEKFLHAQGGLPAIQPLITSMLVNRYMLPSTSQKTRNKIEDLLVGLVVGAGSSGRGASKIAGRAQSKGHVLTHLRERRSARMLKAKNIPIDERPLPGDELEVLEGGPAK